MNIENILSYPFENDFILRKQKSIKRELLSNNTDRVHAKIAILGGSTTFEVKNILEIFLLNFGIQASFYESDYNRYYEESVFDNSALEEFNPDIIFIFTTIVNLINKPEILDSINSVEHKLNLEYERYRRMWLSLMDKYNAVIIQNNIELPVNSSLGFLDSVYQNGMTLFVNSLNSKFARSAREYRNLYIHDINLLSAKIGLNFWHSQSQYYSYKLAVNYHVIPQVSYSMANMVRSILGRNKKCLILDLDNTLWGGVIGDDGTENIKLGRETPDGEAYLDFQKYVLDLKKRGIILAVCSKNDSDIAQLGFKHPDSILQVTDFVVFKANWKPKNINIIEIADEINIGLDSIVFIDDNPVERALIRETLPMVSVPEINPEDVSSYIKIIAENGYFDISTISNDDLNRNNDYLANKNRNDLQNKINSYDEFLESLDMSAEIDSFKAIYLDRITQLTNKSNQFNLTTKRYTLAEISSITTDDKYITLYARLKDKFSDNGLVSVVIGRIEDNKLHIDLWLMSCRVLKRTLENAVFDKLIEKAKNIGIVEIFGYYYKTAKNNMVKDLYASFGFSLVKEDDCSSIWKLDLCNYNDKKNKFIKMDK